MSETRQIIDGFKAAKELTDLFKDAREKITPIQELFVKATEGNNPQDFVNAIAAASELDEDTALGGLIVVMGVLARIKVHLRDTECYDKVKEIFTPKVS